MTVTSPDDQVSQDGKAAFDDIYDRPDPHRYFAELGAHGYQIPAHGQAIFRRLLEARRDGVATEPGGPTTVTDLCCSYGINAALANHHVTYDEVVAHHTAEAAVDADREEAVARSRAFYRSRRRADATRAVGLDVSAPALSFAEDVGLLDAAYCEDLEVDDPSDALRAELEATDLITVTGGIGYVTEATLSRVLAPTGDDPQPWVAALSLRWVGIEPVLAALDEAGLVTETVADRTFRQRRFVDEAEQAAALDALAGYGIDPTGREADGWQHATLHVARPADAVAAAPLADLVEGLGEGG